MSTAEIVQGNRIALDIPMVEIYSDSTFNCRGLVAPIDVVELVRQIEETGLLHPITVQNEIQQLDGTRVIFKGPKGEKYRIVTGNRRFIAFRVMGRDTIPCFIRNDLNEIQSHTINLLENIARADLNMLQEAKALKIYKDKGFTTQDIANEVRKSMTWVTPRLLVLDFPPDIQLEVAAGMLTQEQIKHIAPMSLEKKYEAVRLIKEKKAKGQKGIVLEKPKKSAHTRRERKMVEMRDLQDAIMDAVGPCFAAEVLGWCTGVVSDYEIHRALRTLAESQDKVYVIPKEVQI
jgi:ParB/RepB/Spo0J family partition protein